jgi:hypothetical protein
MRALVLLVLLTIALPVSAQRRGLEVSGRTSLEVGEKVLVKLDPQLAALGQGTVLAVPGDRVELSHTGVLVNGVLLTNLSDAFLRLLPADTVEQRVPVGRYLIAAVMEVPNATATSAPSGRATVRRELGFIPTDRLVLVVEP